MQEINIQRRSPQVNIDTATRNYHLPIASATTLGGIKVGNNLNIENDGTLNAESTEYNLPVATSSTLGGIKIGSGLSITDASLSVNVDSVLDEDSTNPIENGTVATAIATLTSNLQTATGNLSTLGTTVSSLSSTVSSHTSTISTLSSTVETQGLAIQSNTDNISTQASSISDNAHSIGQLDTRLSSAENSITNLNSTVASLSDDDLITLSYTDLTPSSTWTSGNIFIVKRGNVGYVYIDLQGSLTLAASTSEVIYTFTDVIPLIKSSSALLTDDGTIIGEFDDYTYNLSLINLSSQHSITFTKVKGCIPIVFA